MSQTDELSSSVGGKHPFTVDYMFKSFVAAHMYEHPHNEHHHNSFEALTGSNGIANIITSQFKINTTITNNKHDDDNQKIASINYNVGFSGVYIKKPTIVINA